MSFIARVAAESDFIDESRIPYGFPTAQISPARLTNHFKAQLLIVRSQLRVLDSINHIYASEIRQTGLDSRPWISSRSRFDLPQRRTVLGELPNIINRKGSPQDSKIIIVPRGHYGHVDRSSFDNTLEARLKEPFSVVIFFFGSYGIALLHVNIKFGHLTFRTPVTALDPEATRACGVVHKVIIFTPDEHWATAGSDFVTHEIGLRNVEITGKVYETRKISKQQVVSPWTFEARLGSDRVVEKWTKYYNLPRPPSFARTLEGLRRNRSATESESNVGTDQPGPRGTNRSRGKTQSGGVGSHKGRRRRGKISSSQVWETNVRGSSEA